MKKKLGIMQPYFFPYIGYFDVIYKTNYWIVFDVVKYQPKSWMNRNRILEPNKGEQFITVPVEKKTGGKISETRLFEFERNKNKILRQIQVYKNKAPYFDAVEALVKDTFIEFQKEPMLLRDLNVIGLRNTCAYLGIDFEYAYCSDLNLDFQHVSHAGQWALEICDQMNASGYVNSSGGKDLFDRHEWQHRDIKLNFTRPPDFEYPVFSKLKYLPNMSILDCLMWVSPEQVVGYLDSLPLETAHGD
jgi:hypothetical protein